MRIHVAHPPRAPRPLAVRHLMACRLREKVVIRAPSRAPQQNRGRRQRPVTGRPRRRRPHLGTGARRHRQPHAVRRHLRRLRRQQRPQPGRRRRRRQHLPGGGGTIRRRAVQPRHPDRLAVRLPLLRRLDRGLQPHALRRCGLPQQRGPAADADHRRRRHLPRQQLDELRVGVHQVQRVGRTRLLQEPAGQVRHRRRADRHHPHRHGPADLSLDHQRGPADQHRAQRDRQPQRLGEDQRL
ncbi:hypothetical protein SBRY_70271 [Actinacidiphila bryophytorum]|uniref:Uncharacterized protein n=1 Tax=Actinacidiphila bryophytorum TaxID=1436133 RepID=A0A9W4H784_9ACTN|nr:hypothetical protein SBRY_70271 [Actinacidiphila bryophytorum]